MMMQSPRSVGHHTAGGEQHEGNSSKAGDTGKKWAGYSNAIAEGGEKPEARQEAGGFEGRDAIATC